MGGEGEVADGAVLYLRIAALGAPFFMLATAGQGFLRGIGDLRTPLVILVVAHTRQRRCSRCCSSTASAGAWPARRGGR